MLPDTDVIYNTSTDPYFNLAVEEYLIDREDPRPVFMLWRNSAAVIIGRNQNAYAELNEQFVRENGIAVVRRLTGGGAVFHDEGNINYTVIVPSADGTPLDFAGFAAPIISALRSLGIRAELSGRNDIVVDGHKVSGNAQCIRNGRIMHHGTLLWSADLSKLAGALKVDPDKIRSKGIRSVRSRVANLRDLLALDMDVEDFMEHLFAVCASAPRVLTPEETARIGELRDSKYATWDWNWGKSREFSLERRARFPYGTVNVRFDADGGHITDVSITGDFFSIRDIGELCDSLRGVRLEESAMLAALEPVGLYIYRAAPDDIMHLFLTTS